MDHSLNNYSYPPEEDLALPKEWKFSESEFLPLAKDSLDVAMKPDAMHTILNSPTIGIDSWRVRSSDSKNFLGDEYLEDDPIMHELPLDELFDNALYFDNNDGGMMNINYQYPHQAVDTSAIMQRGFRDDSSMSSSSTASTNIGLPLEQRYQATLKSLEASMLRSQATRNCLTMKTPTTEPYERVGSVKEIVSSIAFSSGQVQKLVTSMQRSTL